MGGWKLSTFSEKDSERAIISDCEGPISKNDIAFEISKYFIPDGGELFFLLSKYDDFRSKIVQESGYESGGTLKLILPFLKAYGAKDEELLEYSYENMSFVSGAARTLEFVSSFMPFFIVSTSYEQYIRALCDLTGFSLENTYYTKVSIDDYSLRVEEKNRLKEIRDEIRSLNRIRIPDECNGLESLSLESRETIEKLGDIFREKIPKLEISKMLEDVNPVGGGEKADAVRDISKKLELGFDQLMYVGDSITDVEAFQFLRNNGGLTVSFNGNKYAVRNADIIVLAENTIVTSLLAHIFNFFGKEKVLELVKNWSRKTIKEECQDEELLKKLLDLYPQNLPLVTSADNVDIEKLEEKSTQFRKKVRGERKGGLG